MGRLLGALVLAAGLLTTAARAEDAKFHWVKDEEAKTAELRYGDQPVVKYMYAYDPSTPERLHDTYKVYHHVYGPGTKDLITKGPGGQFTHHRGLYVAWNKTIAEGKSHDFWHCTNGDHQAHVEFVEMTGDADVGTMTSKIAWANAKEDKPVITEVRTIEVRRKPLQGKDEFGWHIDWSTKLTSERGDITLTGDRQHAGFQFRAAQSVGDKNAARFIRPEGFPPQPEAVQVDDKKDPQGHINLNWFAETFPIGDHHYTVAYFEDPSLPKPSRYSERPYGRFGAFFETTLKGDQPLEMRYRVLVYPNNKVERDTLQGEYDQFVKDLKE